MDKYKMVNKILREDDEVKYYIKDMFGLSCADFNEQNIKHRGLKGMNDLADHIIKISKMK